MSGEWPSRNRRVGAGAAPRRKINLGLRGTAPAPTLQEHLLKRGFTLIEVMLALALFGVAVTTFATAYINVIHALSAIQVDQAYEQDLTLIRQTAFSIETYEELEEGGEVFTGSHGEASWDAEYEPTLVADLFKITLTVEIIDRESDEMKEVEEIHYLTRPTWSDPVERAELRADTRDRLLAKQTGLE